MPFTATCPHCDATFTAPDAYAGKKGKCNKCGEKFVIERPASLTAVAAAEEEAEDSWIDNIADEPPALANPVRSPASLFREVTPLKRNFGTLKLFAIAYGLLGVLILCIAVFAGVMALVDGRAEGLLIIGSGVLLCLPMLVVREIITLALAVEENTRITAEVLQSGR